MAIRAYDEMYVAGAQNVLGHAVDFAVMSLEIDPNAFGNAFAVSDLSKQFANGNPRYVAGMNGCELARKVLSETNMPYHDTDDAMFLDKSPEYWAGWALAYYQWLTRRRFAFMHRKGLGIKEVIAMYYPLHEADISKFVDAADNIVERN